MELPERFHRGKQVASYVGLVPEEKSSGDRRRKMGKLVRYHEAELESYVQRKTCVSKARATAEERHERYGSPCVIEIELHRVLRDEWTNVMKWLNNLDLLRAAGLERLILHRLTVATEL